MNPTMEAGFEAQVCDSCLSIDRKTSRPPAAVYQLYSALLSDVVQMQSDTIPNIHSVNMCWECSAVLNKALRLKQRATRAQEWLLWARSQLDVHMKDTHTYSLSSLQCSEIYECSVKYEINQITSTMNATKSEEMFISYDYEDEAYSYDGNEYKSNDVIIELEPIDVKCDYKSNEVKLEESVRFKSDVDKKEVCKDIKNDNSSTVLKRKNRSPGYMFEKVTLNEEEMLRMREESLKHNYFKSAPHKCVTCLTGFRSEAIYQRHVLKYHSLKCGKYICKICDRRHPKKRDLDVHIQEHYISYQCKKCGQIFLDWQTSYRHYNKSHSNRQLKYNRQVQVGEMYKTVLLKELEIAKFREDDRSQLWFQSAPYKCESCIKGFKAESQFQYHQIKYHSQEAGCFVCSICDTRLPDKRILTKHLESHYRCYKCNLCSAKFSIRLTAYRHYLNVHKLGKSYKCKFCSSVFEKRCERKYHLDKMHKTFPCPKCEKVFKHQKVLQQHIETHCPRLCVQCGRTYGTRKAYDAHQQSRHGRREPPGDGGDGGDAYCVECDKRFRSRKEYSHHITVKHTYADRVFPCSDCNKTFKRKLVLKNHYNMVHLKKKNFQCDLCLKCFVNRGVLNHHKTFVHDRLPKPKKHVCDICSKAFSGKNILDNHRRTHTGERPFLCHCCSAAFAQKVALNYHVKRIHLKNSAKASS